MATDNLQIPDIQASQDNKSVTANTAHTLLDRAMNSSTSLVITISRALTTTEARENGVLFLAGTPAGAYNLDMPDTNKRVLTFVNNSGQIATIRNSVGAGVTLAIPDTKVANLFYDGTDIHDLGSGGAEDFLALDDTPVSFSGQANKVATVNPGETGIIFSVGSGGSIAQGNIILVESFNISASTAVLDINFPTDHTRYAVVIEGISPVTDAVDLHCQVTTDGFSTVKSGASDYRWVESRANDAAANVLSGSVGDSKIILAVDVGNVAGEELSGELSLTGARDASFHTTLTSKHARKNAAGSFSRSYGGGRYQAVTVVNGIRLLFSSGNIAQARVALYAYESAAQETGFMLIQEQQATGTSGGNSVAAARQTRDLNFVVSNTITGASLSAPTITLPAGRYFFRGSAPGLFVTQHRLYLRNTSDASDAIRGTSKMADISGVIDSTSTIQGPVTIIASKTFTLEHYTTRAQALNGLGADTADGDINVYAELSIERLGD